MRLRSIVLLLSAFVLAATASTCPVPVSQTVVVVPGFVEPHTPGSGAPVEFPTPEVVETLLGVGADLNQAPSVRTAMPVFGDEDDDDDGRARDAILILVPGFLGGGGTFDPVARDLVEAYGGRLEVWAVDRRSNFLEDRRGALFARAKVEAGDEAGDPAVVQEGLEEAVRFYFEGVDLDMDGTPDPPFELPDASGGLSSFLRLAQNDMRYAAFWGVDTNVRDFKVLVDEARRIVGKDGAVLFGGHSLGTTWAGIFAAYDFDPGPGVLAGHELIDGLLLLEGGGPDAPDADAPELAEYLATVDALAADDGPDVFLSSLFGFVDPVTLGSSGEINGLAGRFLPEEPSILQKTPLFGEFPLSLLLGVPMSNEALPGFFLDDDFTTNGAFSASFGFSDNAGNAFNPFQIFIPGDFLVADPSGGVLRVWKDFDDPTLPTCPPNDPMPALGSGDVGCGIRDNGPRPAPTDPPARWGLEREVTDIQAFLASLYETSNASEWYFVSGRPGLDFQYGRDSSGLGAEDLLNVTQNASVDVPILAIGGSNGLTPSEASFADYLGSVATPPSDQQIVLIEGYAHIDVINADDNEGVPFIIDWVREQVARRQAADDDDDDDDDGEEDDD